MEGMGANIFGSVEGWCLEEWRGWMEWGRIFWVSGRVVLGGGGGTNHVCLYPDPLTLVDIIND